MIIEILELAAALEWIALGVLVFFKLRSLKHQAEVTLEALDAAAWKAIMQEAERMAGISGHALSGQNRRDRYEHCV